jgi:pimeloyl-ACP methyl ester carboxylesterase
MGAKLRDPASKALRRFEKQQRMYDEVRPLRDMLAAGNPDLAAHDEKLWVVAFDLLVDEGELEAAGAVIDTLHRDFPTNTFFRNTAMAFSRLPPVVDDPVFTAFKDDISKEVQVVRRAGAKTVLLGFAGNGGKMSLPLNLIHRWFARWDVHVIYLRDLVTKLYMRGVTALGSDYAESAAALRTMIGELGAERIVCQGHSAGGFAALRFGLELGAAAVLAFGATTSPFLNPDEKTLGWAKRFGVDEGLDLRPLYDRAARTPKARLCYSEANERDAAQARHMQGAPGVTLEPVFNRGQHGVFMPLLKAGRYDELLRELVTGEPAPAPTLEPAAS